MEPLGALPDIPTFDSEPVPVSRNLLTPGTRPLQLLPLPSTEFPVRYETSQMRGFRSELCEAASEMRGAASWLRDASVLGATYFEQLRGAAVGWRGEMRGATSWLLEASVLGATYFEQLRGTAVGWHGASTEVRYVAVLLNAQLV
ncbi:hypothetical protein JCGZ_03966 [Jatropha curcas]|uniref:Uncharacterized protein n=1 Tax=Jatropha curcas TaxID=180498 RepID=A0A067JCX2_JATCU|nr:hypothetical protein JCGZ_03966 [Jatropha curcas]